MMAEQEKPPSEFNPILVDFIRTFVMAILPNKAIMLFFGLKYASNPDEGYGYGLAASILFFFVVIGRFLWKYKDIEDP